MKTYILIALFLAAGCLSAAITVNQSYLGYGFTDLLINGSSTIPLGTTVAEDITGEILILAGTGLVFLAYRW